MEQLKKAVRKSVTGRKMSDQFYVDGDVNVPDDKDDVGRIVYSQGMLRVEDMKQSGSYVRVSGAFNTRSFILPVGMMVASVCSRGNSHLRKWCMQRKKCSECCG